MLFRVLLILAVASPAAALDPFCDPNDPSYQTPHDTTQPYERPNRDIRFCSPRMPASIGPILRCVFTVDGVPYASAPDLLPGTRVTLSNPGIAAGSMTGRCEYPGVDVNGDPVMLVGPPVVVQYVPAPEPGSPVFLSSP